MGKSTRRKQAEYDASELQVQQRLNTHRFKKPIRGVVTATTKGIMTDTLRKLEPYYIRPIENWTYKGKSKDVSKQRLSLLRHLCGIYPVPHFLEHPVINNTGQEVLISLDPNRSFLPWYIAVAQGKSLYKTCTNGLMTKRETHLLLQAPGDLKIEAAIWWAKSVAINGDIGVAYRIARSRIVDRSDIRDKFWQDVHRFFTINPVPLDEISDLIDYFLSERRDNKDWTIKKRSLESVRRKSEEWHRAQYKMKHIGGGSWVGLNVPTWTVSFGKEHYDPQKDTKVTFEVRQILTGNDLAKEGQAMRHCVASYKSMCMNGSTSIFSMTSSTATQPRRRNLTIEVNVRTRQIVQARGLANRSARPQEAEVLNMWGKANNLTYRYY